MSDQSTYEELESIRMALENRVATLGEEYIFYAHDTSGMITFLSPSITKVLGYSREEAMRNYREFLTDHEMNADALKRSEESLKGNIQPPFMNELYHRDGSTRIFYNTELPIYNEKGEITGVEGIAHDITERVATEEELRKQEQIFKLLVGTIEEVFWIHDLKEDLLLYISPRYREVYGMSTNSLYHNPGSFLKAVHPDDRDFVKKAYRKISRGKGLDLEYRIVGQDGTEKLIWTRSFVLTDDRKRPSLSIGTAQDITGRKKAKAEKDIKQSELELREASAAKNGFFSIIAHDLRNPFNSILGLSDILLKDYSSYDKEEILTFIRMINDASKQAHNLLENLLNWSRAQSGMITFEPAGIDVHSAVESIFSLYEVNAREKNLVMINRVLPGTLVYGDANMVPTIFRNLVSNAIKFTRPKGEITVSSRNHRECIDTLFTDTGIGIPKDLLGKLFRIDENVTRPGTANEDGTGLGLILCREFAEKNNGSIKVSSKPGKGSTFSVRLPRPGKQK